MKRYSDQFIADLANLMRHGSEPIDQLIADLSDPDQRQNLIDALGELSRIASEKKSIKRAVRERKPPFTYDDIQTPLVSNGDQETAELLDSLRKKLTTSSSLKSRRVLEDLAHQLNVTISKRDSIPRIIQKMLDHLAALDAKEVAEALNWVKESDRGTTESFMDLASFITRGSNNS